VQSASAPPLPPITLVLGGARSGKSRYAEDLVTATGAGVYLATAEAGDGEMAERIARHRARRGAAWQTVEEPLALGRALISASAMAETCGGAVMVDCLTLWLSNLMGAGRDVDRETAAVLAVLPRLGAPVVFVSNEVGSGIVPATPLGRAFRDEAGRLNQRVAAAADHVVLVVAGLPLVLKQSAAEE
jgi:adenosylcobinamide kinase/adenosylcobinamide-phosphate guanylyltransferase